MCNYLESFLKGKSLAIKLTIISFFSNGHILIEDIPGIGKTVFSLAFARALNLKFGRIQCTSDLLPSDIIGINIYYKKEGEFKFIKGPIFNDILLVDEINRTTPKTQSAFLEAMEERQITVEGKSYKLSENFFVIATQNPLEHYGTFPLPDSQLDRFMMKFSIGYPEKEVEKMILKEGDIKEKIKDFEPIISDNEILKLKTYIQNRVKISDKILDYLLRIANATRDNDYILIGLSTRALLHAISAAKVNAVLNGRDYVIPEDIKFLSNYIFPHRIVLKDSSKNPVSIIEQIMENIPIL